jgi:hypothetical protein
MRSSLAACLLALASACGGDATPTTAAASRRAIVSVAIAPSGTVPVAVGDTARFSVVVDQPTGAPPAVVSWRVSNPAIASITRDGLLTATAPGVVSLLAVAVTPASGAFKADSMVSTVIVSSLPPAISALDVQPGILTAPVGSIVSFSPQVTKAAPSVAVTYAYQIQQNLGSVDGNGVVTTYFPGTTALRITATGSGDGYQTITLTTLRTLNIVPTAGVSSFEISPSTVTVPVGGTVKLGVNVVQPRGAPPVVISADAGTGSAATLAGEGTNWTVSGDRIGTATFVFRAYTPEFAG